MLSGKLKGLFITLILITLIFTIVPDFIHDIATGADSVSDNASNPTILRTIFEFWWLPIGLIILGVIVGGNQGVRRRITGRRRRR